MFQYFPTLGSITEPWSFTVESTLWRTSMRTVFTPVSRQVTPHKFKPSCDLCSLILSENNNLLSVRLRFPTFSVIFIFELHLKVLQSKSVSSRMHLVLHYPTGNSGMLQYCLKAGEIKDRLFLYMAASLSAGHIRDIHLLCKPCLSYILTDACR